MLGATQNLAAVGDQAVVDVAVLAHIRGRTHRGVAHDREVLAVDVEVRVGAKEVHARLVVAGDGADVTPEAVELVGEEALALAQELRDDVLAKVVLGGLIDGVLLEGADQKVRAEDVDAHGREVGVRLLGLLGELGDAARAVGRDDAKAGGLLPGHRHDGDGEVGVVPLVRGQHVSVVHAVELVAREDEHVLGVVLLDVAQVLGHGVSRALVPGAAGLGGVGRQDGDAALAVVEVPGATGADVVVQQVRTVLREHAHRRDPGVRAVGKREVDDAELAAKRDGRLRHVAGQRTQPAALTSGEQHGDALLLAHTPTPFKQMAPEAGKPPAPSLCVYLPSMCQMSDMYSLMVLSLEKNPALAVLCRALLFQARRSA